MAKKHEEQSQSPNNEEELDTGATAEKETDGEPTLEEQLAASRAEAEENYNQFLRARAELENFRKRSQREKEDLSRFANEKILRELLTVIDNLERAVDHADNEADDSASLLEGIRMTLDQFGKLLDQFGVKEVAAQGEPFDPAFHEAMGQVERADCPPNTVAQVFQKGYLLNDRLLRPALVMVAKVPEQPANENDSDA